MKWLLIIVVLTSCSTSETFKNAKGHDFCKIECQACFMLEMWCADDLTIEDKKENKEVAEPIEAIDYFKQRQEKK